MLRLRRHITNVAAALLTAALLQACSGSSTDIPDDGNDIQGITISFSLVSYNAPGASKTMSRAPEDYTEAPGTGSENYIDIAGDDIRFFLFDGTGSYLQDFTPTTQVIGPFDGTGMAYYTCTTVVKDQYFTDATDEKTGTATVDFYIMVIANGMSMRLGYPYFARGTDMEEVFSSLIKQPMLSQPDTSQLLDASKNGQHIPMAGIQRFSVPTDRLRASSSDNPLEISELTGNDVDLLRAMGKIEIIDKIDITGAWDQKYQSDGKRISSVTFSGIMPTGSCVPAIDLWQNTSSVATEQVTSPTRAAGSTYGTGIPIAMLPDPASRTQYHDGFPVFSCYLWEYADGWRSATSEAPYMTVRLQGNPSKTYRLNFRVYNNDGDPSDFERILRNHIYRFEIVGVGQMEGELNAKWTVCPMTPVTIDIPEYN